MPAFELLFLSFMGYVTFIIGALVASMMADQMLSRRFRFATAMLGGAVSFFAMIWLLFEQAELYIFWLVHFGRHLGLMLGAITLHALLGAFAGLTTAICCKLAESVRFKLRGLD